MGILDQRVQPLMPGAGHGGPEVCRRGALGGSGWLWAAFPSKDFFFFFLLQELLNTTRFAQFSDIILKLY